MSKVVKGLVKALSSKRDWWSICVSTSEGDVWISPGIQANQACPCMKGDLITATVEGDYNRVVNGTLTVESVHKLPVQNPNKPIQNTGFTPKPRVNVGQSVGHAINSAFDLLGHSADSAKIIVAAKMMADLTESIRKEYAKNHPELTEYDIGASVGHAVRNAAKIVNERKFDHSKLRSVAVTILENIGPVIAEYIVTQSSLPEPTPVTVPETPVPVVTAPVEPVPEPVVVETPAPVVEAPVVVTPPEPEIVVPEVVAVPEPTPEPKVEAVDPVVALAQIQEVSIDLPW